MYEWVISNILGRQKVVTFWLEIVTELSALKFGPLVQWHNCIAMMPSPADNSRWVLWLLSWRGRIYASLI